MSSVVKTGNLTQDTNCEIALGVLQAAVATAGTGVAGQIAANTAAISYYRTQLSSAIQNKVDNLSLLQQTLRSLGVTS
jgi:hypothetical protein